MKEKLLKILKEAKIEDSAAKEISEGLLAAVAANTKTIVEARAKEEAEAISVVKVKVSGLTKQLEEAKKALSENKESFKKRFEEARQGVKKLIEEDYKSHKAELAQKTKLFVEGKWKEIEGVVKEEMLKEAKEDAASKRVAQISETINKAISTEAPQAKAVDTKELETLKESIETLKAANKKVLQENTELKKKNVELDLQVKKPLKEIVAESKLGKIIKTTEEPKDEKPNSNFLNEIVRLANYGAKI